MKNLAHYYICLKLFSFKICRCFFSLLRALRDEENADVNLFLSTLFFCLDVCCPVVFGCSWLSLQRLFGVGRQSQSRGLETASGLPCSLFALLSSGPYDRFSQLDCSKPFSCFMSLVTFVSISVSFFFIPRDNYFSVLSLSFLKCVFVKHVLLFSVHVFLDFHKWYAMPPYDPGDAFFGIENTPEQSC